MRWHYRDPALVWLFVPAYLCHVAEEYFGGFTAWIGTVIGRPLPLSAFLLINAVALVVMVAAIRAATQHERHGWMAIAVATVLLVNAVLHLLGSMATGTYSPGLITGVVVYVPLAQLALVRAWHQAPAPLFRRGLVAGFVVHALVFVAAATATRLDAWTGRAR